MHGGLSLGISSGSIVPYLELTNVVIPPQSVGAGEDLASKPANELGTVNLLSPGQLAEAGSKALSGQLQQFMGLNDNPSVFVNSIASLIGLKAPASAGTNWPTALTTPFSEEGIGDAIKDPLNAWADYYNNVLTYTTPVEGKRAFTYVLQSFASLLQVGEFGLKVEGDGTPSSPWAVGISLKRPNITSLFDRL